MADDARTLRRDLIKLTQLVRQNTTALSNGPDDLLAFFRSRIQRGSASVAGPFAVGSVDITIAWPLVWPDAGYGIWVSIISGTAALGSLSATLKSGTKTVNDCVITVANTGAGPVGAGFAVDVLGVRA